MIDKMLVPLAGCDLKYTPWNESGGTSQWSCGVSEALILFTYHTVALYIVYKVVIRTMEYAYRELERRQEVQIEKEWTQRYGFFSDVAKVGLRVLGAIGLAKVAPPKQKVLKRAFNRLLPSNQENN